MKNPSKSWQNDLIKKLYSLIKKQDRGELALLRKGIGHSPPYQVYKWIPNDLKPWEEKAALLISALFAYWHQGNLDSKVMENQPRNLGESFLKLVEKDVEKSKEGEKSFANAMKNREKIFVSLLKSHPRDLHSRLRYSVGLLRSKEIPINWFQLLRDIQYWEFPEKNVKRNWAKSFWAERKKDDQDTENNLELTSDENYENDYNE